MMADPNHLGGREFLYLDDCTYDVRLHFDWAGAAPPSTSRAAARCSI
jgi:hypothetical protein